MASIYRVKVLDGQGSILDIPECKLAFLAKNTVVVGDHLTIDGEHFVVEQKSINLDALTTTLWVRDA